MRLQAAAVKVNQPSCSNPNLNNPLKTSGKTQLG
jgi:hypothetical protein